MNEHAKAKLELAAQAVSTAAILLRSQLPTIEAFLEEARKMESFGHIVDPTLYRDPQRRAANAVLEPIFKAALAYVQLYDLQMRASGDALAKVSGLRREAAP